ncbi:hypothetical protein IDH33_01875 [Pelagibacterales bacterium SAG-MED43]|nr:hypothetical protein [Pelagibacterales bacterium SAG-MED43]
MKQPNKKKSICIIGGGFYGCYIAKKIIENFKNIKIEIYEKNIDLLSEAGKNNQYRLHLGFHYPRSFETIKQTQEGSKIFVNEFKKFISKPKKNIYLIHKNSRIKFSTYKNIYRKLKISFKEINLKNIEFLKDSTIYQGAINTNEQVILLDKLIPKLKKFIKKNCKINSKNEIKKINSKSGEIIDEKNKLKKFDYIINTTYTNPNLGLKKKYKIKYEIAGMVKIKNTLKHNAITIMDGPYVSLYPRNNKEASISSVKYTPIKKFRKLSSLKKYLKYADKNKKKIEKRIIDHSKKFFNEKIKIVNKGLILAPKVKILNDKFSERVSLIKRDHKTLSVLCGKLDAAPLAYKKIQNLIKRIN